MKLSERFEDAFLFANHLHRGQTRKGTDIPYAAHLLAVASLVIEDGGDEEMAIAALLHDAVEDQGGIQTLDEIRNRYGERVAEIVDGCTDAYIIPKPPWIERKTAYLEHLHTAPIYTRKVSLADKLHNARSILRDIHTYGPDTLERFNGGAEGVVWYYTSLVEIFKQYNDSIMVGELEQVVHDLREYLVERGIIKY